MKKCSYIITNYLVSKNIISQGDVEIYQYGTEVALLTFIELISILSMSIIVGNFTLTVVFLLAFIPIRLYAGGAHADTSLKCYLCSLMVYCIFSALISIVPRSWMPYLTFVHMLFFLIIIVWFAPIVHQNHYASELEIQNFRRNSLIICLIEIVILLVGQILLNEQVIVYAFSIGLFVEALSILKLKLERRNEKW